MTSTVKTNTITTATGSTLTIGESGKTVALASGATATGFAAVAWQSTVVTGATHTASANQGIWIDTSSNACNLTLPGSPAVGDQLIFADFSRKWGTNAVTLTLNGSKFQGNTSPAPVYDTTGEAVHIVYSGSTQGWIPINDGATALETPQSYSIEYLVVAGGGSAGSGGGGGGGMRTTSSTFTGGTVLTATVGAGGTATYYDSSNNGTLTSIS